MSIKYVWYAIREYWVVATCFFLFALSLGLFTPIGLTRMMNLFKICFFGFIFLRAYQLTKLQEHMLERVLEHLEKKTLETQKTLWNIVSNELQVFCPISERIFIDALVTGLYQEKIEWFRRYNENAYRKKYVAQGLQPTR